MPQLVSESWTGIGPLAILHRHVYSSHAVASAQLPTACSGSIVLQRGAAMLEPDVLNSRAWALDSAHESNSGSWHCETIFDGLGGDRPSQLVGAIEAPKERTRVCCVFNPDEGTLSQSAPVLVCQERCWRVAPSDALAELDSLDSGWVASVIGLECFAKHSSDTSCAAHDASSVALSLGGGIELRGHPGLLEITISSGAGTRNAYRQVVMRRSWAGDQTGRGLMTQVHVVDDMTGEQ